MNLDVAPGFTAVEPGRRRRSGRRAHRPALSRLADAAGPARRSAAPRRRLASGAGIVARRSRRLRRLPQHQRLPADRHADGAAAAAVEDAQRREQRSRSRSRSPTDSSPIPGITPNTFAVDPDFRVGYAQNWQASRAARSAGVADRAGDLSGDQGQPPDAGVSAQHLSRWRRESVSGVSRGLRVSHLERPLDAARRPASAAPPASQRPDRDGAVHAGEGDPTMPVRSPASASTARRSPRTG